MDEGGFGKRGRYKKIDRSPIPLLQGLSGNGKGAKTKKLFPLFAIVAGHIHQGVKKGLFF